jgi:hypothetical protein
MKEAPADSTGPGLTRKNLAPPATEFERRYSFHGLGGWSFECPAPLHHASITVHLPCHLREQVEAAYALSRRIVAECQRCLKGLVVGIPEPIMSPHQRGRARSSTGRQSENAPYAQQPPHSQFNTSWFATKIWQCPAREHTRMGKADSARFGPVCCRCDYASVRDAGPSRMRRSRLSSRRPAKRVHCLLAQQVHGNVG